MLSCFIVFQFNLRIQTKLQLEIQEKTTYLMGKINNNNILLYILGKYEITVLSVTEIHFQLRRRADKQSFNPAQ